MYVRHFSGFPECRARACSIATAADQALGRVAPKHVLVRILVLVTTGFLLVSGRFFVSYTTFIFYILAGVTGPICFWYMLRTHSAILGTIWKHDFGKLFYGVLVSVTVTVSKVVTDQQLRDILQSNPSLFPSAQQLITAYNTLLFILMWITIPTALVMFFRLFHSTRSKSFFVGITTVFIYMYAYMFVTGLVYLVDSDNLGKIASGRGMSPVEQLLIWSSFVPNEWDTRTPDGIAVKKFCTNLASNVVVSPFSTREAMPTQVVMAKLRPQNNNFRRGYEYHLVACDNSARQ